MSQIIDDGEPMDPTMQEAWLAGKAERDAARRKTYRDARLKELRDEIERLENEAAAQSS